MSIAVSLLLKATVVIVAAAAAYAALRPRSSAATRHLLCTLAFASLLALPIVALVGPTWHLAIPSFAAPDVIATDRIQAPIGSVAASLVDDAAPAAQIPS